MGFDACASEPYRMDWDEERAGYTLLSYKPHFCGAQRLRVILLASTLCSAWMEDMNGLLGTGQGYERVEEVNDFLAQMEDVNDLKI